MGEHALNVYTAISPQREKKTQKSEEKSYVYLEIASCALRNRGATLCEMLSPTKAVRSNEGAQSAKDERCSNTIQV